MDRNYILLASDTQTDRGEYGGRQPSFVLAERAIKTCSLDARNEGRLPAPYGEGEESEGSRWTRAVEDPSAPIPEDERASLEGACVSEDGAGS